MLSTWVKNFTDFDAFERSREFARALKVPLQKGTFSKDPTLVYQMRKAILSIYSNFTEGFERDGNREFAQFVSVSKGSIGEIRGQLLYAVDFDYLRQTEFDELDPLAERATLCLGGLLRHLNNSDLRGRKFKRQETKKSLPRGRNLSRAA
jgi:four helix bundle protein